MTPINNGVIYFVERRAKKVFDERGSEIVEAYLTPSSMKDEWYSLSAIDRRKHVDEFNSDLEKRSAIQLARLYTEIRNSYAGRALITLVLNMAVDRGILEESERDRELRYRRSVLAVYGKKRISARGRTPYSLDELELIQELAGDPNYHHKTGLSKGRPSWEEIAAIVNGIFKTGRTSEHLRKKYYEMKP